MRNLVVSTAVAAALAVAMVIPAAASAGLLGNVLHRVATTVQGIAGTSGAPAGDKADAGKPPDYVPPLHGTNPHGQGTVAVADLMPEGTEPLPYDPDGGSEDVVAGTARGEQSQDGSYHGHITIASTFLTGEVLGVDTTQGETEAGPLNPLQEAVLDAICDGSANQVCLTVLAADSSTTEDGSTNHFAIANAQVGAQGSLVSAGVASSDGNISDDGDCQTSTGSSQVANADALGAVSADLLDSTSTSTACNDGSSTQDNTGSGINVLGTGIPLPVAGCENGTPNTNFTPVPLDILLSAVCNADDSNGDQADLPYGVREALSVFLLNLTDNPLIKVTTAAGESQAVAPGPSCPPDCPPPPPPPPPLCDNPPCGPGEQTEVTGGGGNAGELPFTGADLLTLLLVGLGVTGLGLATMAYADARTGRRRS